MNSQQSAITNQQSVVPTPWTRPWLTLANYASPILLIATNFSQLWLIAMAVLAHGLFFYAIVAPNCGWLCPVVTRFRPNGHEVWLTIDDGPAGEATVRLAEEMRQRGVRATFFVKGKNLVRDPEIAQTLMAAGHTLANHTQTHPSHIFSWLFPRALRAEIDVCNEALRRAGVATLRWFRSPVGLKHLLLHPELSVRGMRQVAWSVRAHDGVICEPAAVSRRVAAQVKPGAIVLMHEGRKRSNEAILRVIDELLRRGYSFVIPRDEQLV